MSHYIAPTKTEATPEEAFAAFRLAATDLGPESLCVLVAHWALESGVGQRMFCWNIGGAKATVGGGKDWTFLTTHEVENGVSVKYSAPPLDVQAGVTAESLARMPITDPMRRRIVTTCFRAYETFQQGIDDHVGLIRKRFSPAWAHVEVPNPTLYALTLGSLRYYTAPRDQYANAVANHYARFVKDAPGWRADA